MKFQLPWQLSPIFEPIIILGGIATLFSLVPILGLKGLHAKHSIWPAFFAWFFGGTCFGLILTLIPDFRFSNEVDLVKLLTIFVTITVAFLFQYFLKSRTDSRKTEKDLVLAQIKMCGENVGLVRKIFLESFAQNSVKVELIRDQLRTLSNSINLTETLLDAAKLKHDKKLFPEIKNSYLKYKKVLTGKPFPAPYTDKQFSHEEKLFERLHKALILFSLQVTTLP